MARELVTCANGHYYDASKYDSCPYCKPGGLAGMSGDKTEPLNIERVIESVPSEPSKGTPAPVAPAPSDDDALGKTVGMAMWQVSGQKNETEAEETVIPVVGWLVCISGPDCGKSFNLKAGKNYIGRDAETSDVVLSGDKAVSRTKHAIFVFDPKTRKFYVQPGTSSELYYLNDEVVLQVREVKDRDTLSIGDSELRFVAFCDDSFSWAD